MLGDRRFDRAAELAADQPAVLPRLPALDRILVEAPSLLRAVESARAPYVVAQRPMLKRDYLDREARNASLGKAGEECVVAFEQQRLHRLGFRKLADNVDRVAASKGDGLDVDVHSFDVSGKDVLIEVKTTAWRKETPFLSAAMNWNFQERIRMNFISIVYSSS